MLKLAANPEAPAVPKKVLRLVAAAVATEESAVPVKRSKATRAPARREIVTLVTTQSLSVRVRLLLALRPVVIAWQAALFSTAPNTVTPTKFTVVDSLYSPEIVGTGVGAGVVAEPTPVPVRRTP